VKNFTVLNSVGGVDEICRWDYAARTVAVRHTGGLMFIQKKATDYMSDIIDLRALMTWPSVVSRTIPLQNRRARLRLETAVWSGLDDIAQKERRPIRELCIEVDTLRPSTTPLTSAIRNYVLDYYRKAEGIKQL